MFISRREGFSTVPIAAGTLRGTGAKPARTAETGSFRSMAAALSQQVRTYNTTGKIQDLQAQVASGEYRPDARETAARMLLMGEGE